MYNEKNCFKRIEVKKDGLWTCLSTTCGYASLFGGESTSESWAFLKPLLGLRFRLRLGALRTQWNRSEYEPSLQAYTFISVILHAVV